ncbi:MAG: DNA-directed RNA polymerase subunit K [Nitrososphaeria archaeon]
MSEKRLQKAQTGFQILIGPPRLTKYERARIIGARALQLSYGAPPFIPIKGTESVTEIAKKELEMKALPISIRRQLPDGTYQDIPIHYLL